jgi:hypothetical protein
MPPKTKFRNHLCTKSVISFGINYPSRGCQNLGHLSKVSCIILVSESQQCLASVLKIHHGIQLKRSLSLSMHPVHYQRAPTQTCRQFCGVCDGFCACVTSPRAAWTRNSASPRPTEMNTYDPMKLKQEGDRRLRRSRM